MAWHTSSSRPGGSAAATDESGRWLCKSENKKPVCSSASPPAGTVVRVDIELKYWPRFLMLRGAHAEQVSTTLPQQARQTGVTLQIDVFMKKNPKHSTSSLLIIRKPTYVLSVGTPGTPGDDGTVGIFVGSKVTFHVEALELSCDKTSSRVSSCRRARLETRQFINDPTPVCATAFIFQTVFRKVPTTDHDFHHFTCV